MSTNCKDVPAGMPISEQWELEKDLFNWGVLPKHQALVMDAVNKHLMDVHEQHSTMDITADSAFPENADEVEWVKINPQLTDSGDLGNYIHIWAHPETGQLFITVLRPDLEEYDEQSEEDAPEEEEEGPWGWTRTEYNSAKFGEEG